MRGAHLDWHEQGDVWHRVTQMRPLSSDTATGRLPNLATQVRRLLSLDARPSSPTVLDGGPIAVARTWLAAFTEAGHALAAAAQDGTLRRGLRDILAHHVIFHWNRFGIPDHVQSTLAHGAVVATLNTTDAGADVAPT